MQSMLTSQLERTWLLLQRVRALSGEALVQPLLAAHTSNFLGTLLLQGLLHGAATESTLTCIVGVSRQLLHL